MKIAVFGCLKEEIPYFELAKKTLPVELSLTSDLLTDDNISLAKGCDAISVLATSAVNEKRLIFLKDAGVKYVGARCIGYNHIDLVSAKKLDIRVCNAVYSEHCVADFTLMLMLMCIRNVPYILRKNESYDYRINGMMGREMPNLTVGIVGTGRIGKAVAKRVHGFGSRIIAFDPYPSKELSDYVQYVSLEKLYQQSDIITFHAPYNKENYHMLNQKNLSLLKDGVIIINAARGELVESQALIEGLDSGKIAGAGIDCFEEEYGVIQYDLNYNIKKRHDLMLLQGYPNVVFTPHVAFYTDQAVKDLVIIGLKNLLQFESGESNPAEVTA
ncbi:MAG: NAD(P)-dependent oxidoreductase [Lachnospiraceae bacterium]|nr:NAD(P)-dependent oxidoreductase [Lachnospiraceae bacterium]